jgi:hypothetical protein
MTVRNSLLKGSGGKQDSMRCEHEAHGSPKIEWGDMRWPMRRSGALEHAVSTSCSARKSAMY